MTSFRSRPESIAEIDPEKSENRYDSMMQELDKRVAELYGITDDELVEIETDLKLLLNETKPPVERKDEDDQSDIGV